MLVHLPAVDLETVAELDRRAFDNLSEFSLACQQRQLFQVMPIQIKQIEGDQHDPGRSALQLVLQHREITEATCRGHDYLTIDNGRARIDLRSI